MEPKLITNALAFAFGCFMLGFGLGYRIATHRVLKAYEESLTKFTNSLREEIHPKNNERKRHEN